MRFQTMLAVIVCAALPACGDGGSDGPKDAAIDAPVDMLVDAPEPPANTFRFVIDKERIPQNNTQARDLGLDLNDDQTVDNQFGMVLATLAGQGFATQPAADDAVARGTLLVLVEVTGALTSDGPGTYAHFTGTNPMPTPCSGPTDMTCRRHLAGTATFDAAPTPRNTPLAGTFVAGTFSGGPGKLQLPIGFGPGMPISVELIGARVRVSMASGAKIGEGIVAGAMTTTEIETKLYPRMQQNMNEAVMRDCTMLSSPPDCGCMASSTGKSALGLFDTPPKDCNISLDEIRNNSLIQSLFAPDVTIDGMPGLSVGVGITAVRAGFVP